MQNQYNQSLSASSGVVRLEEISDHFRGRPYLLGALGEGANGRFDQNPLYRFDAFDCLTYVNTVLALFFSESKEDFEKKIIVVNYRDGEVAYQNRHHFMVDWNASNAKLNFLQDFTDQITENNLPVCRMSKTLIDRPNWFRLRGLDDIKLPPEISLSERLQRVKELHDFAKQFSAVESILPYLPLDRLFDERGQPNMILFDQIPSGVIAEIVRPDWNLHEKIGTNLDVSHVGFIFKKENQLIFRDANSTKKAVIDTPLIDYLKNYLNHETIKGINLQQITGVSPN